MENHKKTNSLNEFRQALTDLLTFKTIQYDNRTIYKNTDHPERGQIIHYSRPGCYDVLLGNYSCCQDFMIDFNHHETLLRLGTVYEGHTNFKMSGHKVNSFTPSSFFALEKEVSGRQLWRKDQHFTGTELMINLDYIHQRIAKDFPAECQWLQDVTPNTTYRYLPADLTDIIHRIERLAAADQLTCLRIDGMILESVAVISSETKALYTNQDTGGLLREKIKIGNREVSLSLQDIDLIQQAHRYIEQNACTLPTIDELSSQLQINPQKLKAGFSHIYHMTVWEFANSVRMSIAAQLLMATDKSILEIANDVGYSSSPSFASMFKRHYRQSPREFRNRVSSN